MALDIVTGENQTRFTTVVRLLDMIERFDGAIIECGVHRGASLMGILHHLYRRGVATATLYGCDSFQGLPTPTAEDAQPDGSFHHRAAPGTFGDTSRRFVEWRIRAVRWPYEVRFLEGRFDRTLPTLGSRRFLLAHVDCDLYESYRVCLRELYPRMLPGGYMVFDEYDAPSGKYPGSRRAIDEFLADKPEKVQAFFDLSKPRHFISKL